VTTRNEDCPQYLINQQSFIVCAESQAAFVFPREYFTKERLKLWLRDADFFIRRNASLMAVLVTFPEASNWLNILPPLPPPM
jgi:predicted GNAT superfamily acetyltransferase